MTLVKISSEWESIFHFPTGMTQKLSVTAEVFSPAQASKYGLFFYMETGL